MKHEFRSYLVSTLAALLLTSCPSKADDPGESPEDDPILGTEIQRIPFEHVIPLNTDSFGFDFSNEVVAEVLLAPSAGDSVGRTRATLELETFSLTADATIPGNIDPLDVITATATASISVTVPGQGQTRNLTSQAKCGSLGCRSQTEGLPNEQISVILPGTATIGANDAASVTVRVSLSQSGTTSVQGFSSASLFVRGTLVVYQDVSEGDIDGDGIRDIDEIAGRISAFGHEILLPRANPFRKTLYVEVDAMEGVPPLSIEAIRLLEQAFANAPVPNPDGSTGIDLVIEMDETDLDNLPFGTRFPVIGTPQPHPEPNGRDLWGVDRNPLDRIRGFDDLKLTNFGPPNDRPTTEAQRAARQRVWRYCILANTSDRYDPGVVMCGTPSGCPSPEDNAEFLGLAELYGNDFMIFVDDLRRATGRIVGTCQMPSEIPDELFENYLTATFMHELGHTLGLGHGGTKPNGNACSINSKPNYFSIMNYRWTLPTPRYGIDALQQWRLDFSRFNEATLDEMSLPERRPFNTNDPEFRVLQHAVDDGGMRRRLVITRAGLENMNWDGVIDLPGQMAKSVAADVNWFNGSCETAGTGAGKSLLHSFSDWDRIRLIANGSGTFGDFRRPATHDGYTLAEAAERSTEVGNDPCAVGQSFGDVQLAAGVRPNSIAVGDFNGDGATDIIIANRGMAEDGGSGEIENDDLSIYLGDGNGGLEPERRESPPTTTFRDVTQDQVLLEDIDGDGYDDLLLSRVAFNGLNVVDVIWGNPDAEFSDPVYIDDVTVGFDIEVILDDMTDDGRPDIVSATPFIFGGRVAVRPYTGNRTFGNAIETDLSSTRSVYISTGDFNGDGVRDLLSTSAPPFFSVEDYTVLLGNGDGSFADPRFEFNDSDFELDHVPADLNGDGFDDIAFKNISGEGETTIRVLFNLGDATFGPEISTTIPDVAEDSRFQFYDADLDGNLDLLVGPGSLGGPRVFRGLGDGTFGERMATLPGEVGGDEENVLIADLNGDGLEDVLWLTNTLGTMQAATAVCEVRCPIDVAEPFGELTISDVLEVIDRFERRPEAFDVAAPIGTPDFFDILAVLQLFDTGCGQ
ncbi:MAG: VCBS repeat-containing protein [Planctomycetota bacterium]